MTKAVAFRLSEGEIACLREIARADFDGNLTAAVRGLIVTYMAGAADREAPIPEGTPGIDQATYDLAIHTPLTVPLAVSRGATSNTPVATTPVLRDTAAQAARDTCKGGPYTDRGGMTMCDTCGRPQARH